jgi:hypothetical protein
VPVFNRFPGVSAFASVKPLVALTEADWSSSGNSKSDQTKHFSRTRLTPHYILTADQLKTIVYVSYYQFSEYINEQYSFDEKKTAVTIY